MDGSDNQPAVGLVSTNKECWNNNTLSVLQEKEEESTTTTFSTVKMAFSVQFFGRPVCVYAIRGVYITGFV